MHDHESRRGRLPATLQRKTELARGESFADQRREVGGVPGRMGAHGFSEAGAIELAPDSHRPGADVHVPAATGALPPALIALASARLGYDLSSVRVAEGEHVRAAGARAWASGDQIHFAPGEYDPSSRAGRDLIGHELVHLAQQADGRVAPGSQAKGGGDNALEAEADAHGATLFAPRATPRAPLRPLPAVAGAPRQLKPTRIVDVKPIPGGTELVPHKTQPVDRSGHLPEWSTSGTGAHVEDTLGATAALTNQTAYAGTDVCGEGTGVTAMVGPTHPVKGVPGPFARTTALDRAAATGAAGRAFTAYETMQLLPGAVGGLDAPDNLIAVPDTVVAAVKAQGFDKIERLVRKSGAWIGIDAAVTHDDDAATGSRYARDVTVRWWELDPRGGEVADTRGVVAVQAESPAQHGKGTAATVDRTPGTLGLGGPANAATRTSVDYQRAAGTAVTWRTEITWGATTTDGDGTYVEAHKLGPDHKLGEKPKSGDDLVWNQRAQALTAATGLRYVSGHLLNHHVGGPGNDARNLAPIPGDANTVEATEIEAHVKKLVNDEKAWVYYRVKVEHDRDSVLNINYPKAFDCSWYQLDVHGAPVHRTGGHKKMRFAPPDQVKTQTAATKAANAGKAKKNHVANQPTYKIKPHKHPRHTGARPATARTRLAFDEIILDEGLGKLVKYQRPLVLALDEMKLAGFFTDDTDEAGQVLEDLLVRHGPTPAELTAFTDLDQITTELESLSVRHDDVVQVPAKIKRAKQLLGVIHSQRKPRMALLRAGAEAHARKTFESDRAQQIVDRLDQAIKETNEAYRGYAKALGRTLRLAKRVAGETARLQDEQRNALNTVREWNGADPMEFDDVPTDYADETTLQVTGIATTLQSFHENPGSPMQVFNGAVSFGYTPHDANEAQHLLAHRSIADQCPPWSASGASRSQYDQLLCAALLREFKQDQLRSWPSFPGGANEVAEQIQFMADGIAATGRWNQSFVDGTIERLYHHETGDFDVYWRWLSTKV